MIKSLFNLPNKVTVALSGGVDSVAITDFLSKHRDVECAFFHHGTENSERALEFVTKFCSNRNIKLLTKHIHTDKSKDQSKEEYWRVERYKFLESIPSVVITAHNLDDCVETYLFGAIHGTPKTIPSVRNNIVRPFLTTKKSEFISWCTRKEISWCEDTSNMDTEYMRNYIRHNIIPHALHVNPGLHKVVKKIVENKQPQYQAEYGDLLGKLLLTESS